MATMLSNGCIVFAIDDDDDDGVDDAASIVFYGTRGIGDVAVLGHFGIADVLKMVAGQNVDLISFEREGDADDGKMGVYLKGM